MFSTYLAWTLMNAGIPFWVAFIITLVAAFIGGAVIERVIIRRSRTRQCWPRSSSSSAWN